MASSSRGPRGLAARIVRVTLAAGFVTVVVAGAVALVSVSSLASERAASRDLIALRLVEGTIEERLGAATGLLDKAGAIIAAAESEESMKAELRPLTSGDQAVFSNVSVAQIPGGGVLFSEPDGLTRRQVRTSQAYLAAIRGASGYGSTTGENGTPVVWATRTTVSGWQQPVVLIATLDSGFIRRALESAVREQPGRVALLFDDGRLVGSAGTTGTVSTGDAQWVPEGKGLGRVIFTGSAGRRYSGYYYDIETVGDVRWRIVAAEPSVTDLRATVSAVAAPIGILAFGGIVSALLGWAVTTRLVRPLRDLERTARAAASGAYVKPLASGSDDEIGRVADAFNQVALRLNALHDLSQLLASASRLDQVLDGILSAMEHIVGRGAAAIYLVDSERGRLVPARTRGVSMASVLEIPLDEGGWLATALRGSGPVTLAGSPDMLKRELPGLSAAATSALAAPLVAGHDPLGVVVILREGSVQTSDAEQEMVRTFSAQAAVAVQTSRLFEIESESRRVAEALRDVAEQLVRPEALESALVTVERTIRELYGARMVHVAVADGTAMGLPEDVAREREQLLDMAMTVRDVEDETVVLRRGAHGSSDALLEEYDGEDLLVMPIGLSSNHPAALIAVLPQRPDVNGIEVARALSDEIALALDNAYFYERALMRAANLETIFRISQAVASPLQVNVVLNRVLDVVQKILSADAVMLWSYDSRKRTLGTAMVRGDVPATMVGLELTPGEDLPGRVFQSGEPVVLRGLSERMGGVAGSAAAQGLSSLIAVPLLARGRPIGALTVLSTASDAFGDEDLSMLQTFASQAALAIDTARLYSREHEVAHVLQQSILPEDLPDMPEVEAGSMYAPAGGEADIGGDYYDLFRGPDGSIWFAIADVCGKGVHAATKTSMIKYALRALVAAGLGPGRIAEEVNRMTAEAGDPSDIVTLWVGRYQPGRESLQWADGGHPPAILRRSDGTVERLGPTGPILGAVKDVEFAEGTTAFRAGDRVLLYTDGVTEARQGNIFFGEERVASALTADRSAQEDARRLLESVRAFVRADLRDDVAVLVIAANVTNEPTGV